VKIFLFFFFSNVAQQINGRTIRPCQFFVMSRITWNIAFHWRQSVTIYRVRNCRFIIIPSNCWNEYNYYFSPRCVQVVSAQGQSCARCSDCANKTKAGHLKHRVMTSCARKNLMKQKKTISAETHYKSIYRQNLNVTVFLGLNKDRNSVNAQLLYSIYTLCVSKNCNLFVFYNNSVKSGPISIIFGAESWGNVTPEGCKFVHLTWNMSPHYFVKFQKVIFQVYHSYRFRSILAIFQ